jgi:hypothetical protein
MVYKKSKKDIIESTQKTLHLIEERGHEYIRGSFENRSSVLVIWCPVHGNEQITTFHNYNRSRTGCLCCGREQVSQLLKNRQFTEETRKKMCDSAQHRPNRGGKPRRWRETYAYRQWREKVLTTFKNKCAVTGFQKQNTGDLVVHHLYGTTSYPNLVYTVENGIVLHKKIHLLFHTKYGYNGNTLEQFSEFLLFLLQNQETLQPMLISSRGELENSQGSETRAYDPERVMKLHERLGEILYTIQMNYA